MIETPPLPFFYRTCFNFFLSVFYLWFSEIPYLTPLCISFTIVLWVCCVMVKYGHRVGSAILIWHAASCVMLVGAIAISGGVTSEYIPIVSLVLVSGFAVDNPKVGIITAYFVVVLYCGVLLLPKSWDVMRHFPYRDSLRVVIFVFSMFCHSSFHKTITCKLKTSTEHELKKAARQTTALIDMMAMGVPMIAMTATDLMNKEQTEITEIRKRKHLNSMVARTFSAPLAILVFYYFDKIALVYIGCGMYTIMLVSLYLYWIASARIASIVFHLTVYVCIQGCLAITGGIHSVLVPLVQYNVVAIFYGLGYSAGVYSANFAITWYCVLFFCPSSWNILSSSTEAQLDGYRVFFCTNCMLGIISFNINLRRFLNRHVRKLELHLLELGMRLGLPVNPPHGKSTHNKRCAPIRLKCTVCQQMRWHTCQPTVIRTDRYGPGLAYMCTKCKSKSVVEMFPENTGSSIRYSDPPVPETLPDPQEPEKELSAAAAQSQKNLTPEPVPPICKSKEEVKDQLFKLLQASDAWMDALQKTES